MKKVVLTILGVLLFVSVASADYRFNPYTGKQDYYESGSAFTETADGAYIDGDVSISQTLSTSTVYAQTVSLTGDGLLEGLDSIDATTETTLETAIDHDDLTGFVAGEHVNYTTGLVSDDVLTKGDLSANSNLTVLGKAYFEGGAEITGNTWAGDITFSDPITTDGVLLAGDSAMATVLSPSDVVDFSLEPFPMWVNDTGVTVYIHDIESWAWGQDDTAFTLTEVDADGTSNSTTIEACNTTTGADPYHDTVAKADIDNNTIEDGACSLA